MLSLFISEFFSFPKTQQNKNEKKKEKEKKNTFSSPHHTIVDGRQLFIYSFFFTQIYFCFFSPPIPT